MISDKKLFLATICTVSFFSKTMFADNYITRILGRFFIPPIEKSLQLVNPAQKSEPMPERFNLLVWNIHKAKDGDVFKNDLLDFAKRHDVMLLQEGMQDNDFTPFVKNSLGDFEWYFAQSFGYTKTLFYSGTTTATRFKTEKSFMQRTLGLEPIIKTPKTTMLSVVPLNNGKKIIFANIHGINKGNNNKFFDQIDEVIAAIKNHSGPAIFAGDFNTNKKEKMPYLIAKGKEVGLEIIEYKDDKRKNKLDWILVRGCKVISSTINYNVTSSDHNALESEFLCD